MKVDIFDDGLRIDEAELIYSYRNFSGRATQYNDEGNRNFAVRITDPDVADALKKAGWNVKIKAAKDEGEPPFMYLPVKVKYRTRTGEQVKNPPTVYAKADGRIIKFDETMIGALDGMDILNADLDIRAMDWDFANRSGRAAYLNSMMVYQDTSGYHSRRSRFDKQYDEQVKVNNGEVKEDSIQF